MYQEILHIPLLIWHPSIPGRDIDLPASLVDIAPTLIDWLRLKKVKIPFSGRSFAVEKKLKDPDLQDRPVFSSGIAYGSNRVAVVYGNWKRVFDTASESAVLFHLSDDPMEIVPREEKELQIRMDTLIADYRAMKPYGPVQAPRLTEEELERLQSLGYLMGADAGREEKKEK
jgi:arylsulfatase A-like enzyme